VDLFTFELAKPIAPSVGPEPPSGVNLSADAEPRVDDAFALEGVSEDGALSMAVELPDFNGDRIPDLLVAGADASYVLLGPVELDSIEDVEELADFIIDGEVGMPAGRMGDINGDGQTDLVFITRPSADDGSQLNIILGSNGLPRFIDQDVIEAMLLENDGGQDKVRRLSLSNATMGLVSGASQFSADTASLSVLNWDDDGFADVLIAASAPQDATSGDDLVGFILSGEKLANDLVFDATQKKAQFVSLAEFRADTTNRIGEALNVL
jgi:hypothetical protein